MNAFDNTAHLPAQGKGGSPFETIRRVDIYGREYWSARELMPLLGYTRWDRVPAVVDRASAAAANSGHDAEKHLRASSEMVPIGSGAVREVSDWHLTRYGAYLVALNGDPRKPEIAAAQTYFAVMTREAELNILTAEDIQRTALARAREMVDYRTFRDMMAENAPDYVPSTKATGLFFAAVQNKLYLNLTGLTAKDIKTVRPLSLWPGREAGKPEPSPKSSVRKIAKNYLTELELGKLNRIVGRLCLRAEDIAEDGLHLTLPQWQGLVDLELLTSTRQLAA